MQIIVSAVIALQMEGKKKQRGRYLSYWFKDDIAKGDSMCFLSIMSGGQLDGKT